MAELVLPCFTATAFEPNGAGVVVAHEGLGMTTHVMRFAERLAAEGYAVVAPDFFFRTGGPKDDDFWASIRAVTPEQLYEDLATAIGSLRAQGSTSIGVTGFCMGGTFAYCAAKWADALGVDAVVAFYGGEIAQQLGDLRCPTLLLFAGCDEYVPAHDVAAVQAYHGDAVIVYPNSQHSFMRDGTANYDPHAAADAWSRLLVFFGEHLR